MMQLAVLCASSTFGSAVEEMGALHYRGHPSWIFILDIDVHLGYPYSRWMIHMDVYSGYPYPIWTFAHLG